MSLTQIERNTINALGTRGPMGVTSLMPLVDGLEGKIQLVNVLEGLQKRGITKKKGNGQWVILKAIFSELQKSGELDEPKEKKPAAKSASPTDNEVLKDIPSLSNIGKRKKGTQTNVVLQDTELVSDTVNASDDEALSLSTLISELPADTEISISNSGLHVSWNGIGKFEPSTEELPVVLNAIETLQAHAVGHN